MILTMKDLEVGTKVRFTAEGHPWYKRRNTLFGKVVVSPFASDLVKVSFYIDNDYTKLFSTEGWKPCRFSLEDRIEEPGIQRTKLERKCRKLWNQSNYVKSNPSRAY